MQIYKCDRCAKLRQAEMEGLALTLSHRLVHVCVDCLKDFNKFMLEKSDNPNIVTGSGIEKPKDKIAFVNEYLVGEVYNITFDKQNMIKEYFVNGHDKYCIELSDKTGSGRWDPLTHYYDLDLVARNTKVLFRIVEKS